MPTATRTIRSARNLTVATLVPARVRSAYPVVTCLVADITAPVREWKPTERAVEVSYAENAAGRNPDEGAYLVVVDGTTAAVVDKDTDGTWSVRKVRGVTPVQTDGTHTCDGASNADKIVMSEDAPDRVLLRQSYLSSARTRKAALAQAGFVV